MGDAYASDGERLDWVLWQISRGMNLMFVTSRRDIDELMAQDDAAGLSALWCPSARNREAPAHREGSQGLVGSTVLQDADANSEGSNASSHRAPVDSNLHPLCDVPLGGTPMLSDDERFTVEHIRAFARGDSSSWAGWTRSLVAIIDRLLAARPPAPSDATGYLPPELEREYQRVVSSFYEDISPASSEAVRLFEVHQCGNARSPEAGASPAAPILEEREADEDYDEASAVALQVLCRVFEDGADVAMEEWREWYKPEQWLWHARGLGAFIASRLAEKRELTADERGAFERLQAAMHLVSGKSKPVEITMRDANCLVHAIAQPPRSAPPDQHPEVDALIRNLARAGRRAWDEGRYVDYQHFTHAIKALRARPLEDPEEKTNG